MSKFKKLFIVFGMTLTIVFFLLLPFLIKVKTVCVSQYGPCPFELESGSSLYQTNIKIANYLKKQYIVSNFSTQFKLPNILVVNILLKKPSFVLKNDSNQEVSVDQNGIVLGTVNNSTLPEVDVVGNLKKPGENIDQSYLFALNLINGVNEMYQVKTGTIQDNTLVVELPIGIKVIFPLNGDIQVLLGSLRLIYSKIESNNQDIRYSQIDLRFKNPVLKIM